MKKRRTKTTIEVHEVYVIRQPESLTPVLCSECVTGTAAMVTPEDAAKVVNIPVRQVYRLVEAELIHYLEAESGLLLVCLNSLPTIVSLNEFD